MSSFSPGQVWTMSGAGLTETRIVVGDVERKGHETIVHVSILNVPIPEDIAPGGRTIDLPHAPFQEDALAKSVDSLERGGARPHDGFASGYETWTHEEDAGAYSIPATEAIAQIFQALRDS